MLIVRTLPELTECCGRLRHAHGALALVPTMGALHAGHRALVAEALRTGAATATSIFVNPLQFGANEDLSRYPRDEAGDLATLEACGCHLAWLPSVETMYPPGEATLIDVSGPAERWEGTQRPGHFRGMATVVAKLLGQVRPDLAFFGEKDWQQLQVIARMVADLLMPVRIVGVPTVRETDGLALSSRNRFLTAEERRLAPLLFAALADAAGLLASGSDGAGPLRAARDSLSGHGFRIDYLELVDGPTLQPISAARPRARLIGAARLGSVRLLDNLAVG